MYVQIKMMSGQVYTVNICIFKEVFGKASSNDVKDDISIFLGVETGRIVIFKEDGEELLEEEIVNNKSIFNVFVKDREEREPRVLMLWQ